MHEFEQDLGIIMRSNPLNERDKLITVLTENHGKISGVAKGAIHSRRYGGSLDLFTCSSIRFKKNPHSDLVRIEEANTRRDFVAIRKHLESISAAGYFVDLCTRLTDEGQPVREVFLLLTHYLYLLESSAATYEVVRSFEMKLLDRLGWAPTLESCAQCQNAFFQDELPIEQSYATLTLEGGGFLCTSCKPINNESIPLAAILWMIQARETKIRHTPSLKFPIRHMQDATKALQLFLRWHCPGLGSYHFQSHSMLEQFLQEARRESETKDTKIETISSVESTLPLVEDHLPLS
ncbi:MAG: DNA repair protein RecO [Oligoflexia bacterium]|nr:DNA repair protein RecO [Oligoflexia bacterium]